MTRAVLILVVPALLACGPRVFGNETAKLIESVPPPPPPKAEAAKPEPRVEITDDKIIIREKVQFAYNKATIKRASDGLLAEVAKVLNDNPRLKKVRVEGHASSEGDDSYNLRLSRSRAKAVMNHLVKRGKVDPARLGFEGYGETRPLVQGDTDEAREANRRVEFTIVEQDWVETKTSTDPVTGRIETETIDHPAGQTVDEGSE